MRVAFVTSGLDTGGAEFALLRLLPAMESAGIESCVVSLRTHGTVGPLLRATSIPVLHLGLPSPCAALAAIPRLSWHIRKWKAALVHGWMYHGNLAAWAAAGCVRTPVAWGIRQALERRDQDKWLTRRVIKAGALLSRRPKLIVYNSDTARLQHEARGYASDAGAVVPNGFDTSRFRPDDVLRAAVRRELGLDSSALVVAQLARFHAVKDYPTFLRAVAALRTRFPQAVFLAVGDGVDATNRELAACVRELGLTDRVRLLGRRDDVARLLPACDVVCLTSLGESFPNVIGEAMSCAVPCVATAVGDVAELIGETGEVVPVGDAGAVAEAVQRLLALKSESRRELGALARQRIIDRYSIEQVARRYAELLFSVAESAKPR